MNKIEENQREKEPDFSIEIPCMISQLNALVQLMVSQGDSEGGLNGEETRGLGLIIGDIARQLKEVNEGLYGE